MPGVENMDFNRVLWKRRAHPPKFGDLLRRAIKAKWGHFKVWLDRELLKRV